MSISIAADRAIPIEWVVLALASLILGGITLVVLRRGSVAGPLRVLPTPGSLRQLAGVTVVGLVVWVLIPGMLAAEMQAAPEKQPETQPATELATEPATPQSRIFTPRQSVIVSIAAGLGAAAAIIITSVMFRPGGLRQLGFSLDAIPRGVVLGALAALLVLPLTFLAAVLTDKFWQLVGLEHPGAHEMLRTLAETSAPGLRALIYISAVLVAPLFEELLFRGHIQSLLAGAFSAAARAPEPELGGAGASPAVMRWLAILVTSVLFTLVHGALWMMPPILILSLCLGYIYERTANLWAPLVVHLLFNGVNVVLFVNLAGR